MTKVWNDTDIPLAYFITFRTYGTWLPGDERGSIDRFHNAYQSPRAPNNEIRERSVRDLMKHPPVLLNAERRAAVDNALREVCATRKWDLLAINVRTNHVHTVVNIGIASSKRALNDFKSYATRGMREKKCWKSENTPWVRGGSRRRLWNEQSIWMACDYVINGQGDDLPDFLRNEIFD